MTRRRNENGFVELPLRRDQNLVASSRLANSNGFVIDTVSPRSVRLVECLGDRIVDWLSGDVLVKKMGKAA